MGGYTAQGIDHLTGHHTVGAGGVGQHPDGLHPALRRHTGGLGNEPKCLRLEGIPRQHRQRLAVGLMAGRLSPPQVVVIHTGQVVVNEGVGVDQLQRTGIGQSQVPVYPTQTGHLQRQHWADALAAAQKAVPHGLLQSSIGLIRGEKSLQILLNGRLIGGISGVKIHGHSSLANSVSTGAPSGPFISRTTCCSA